MVAKKTTNNKKTEIKSDKSESGMFENIMFRMMATGKALKEQSYKEKYEEEMRKQHIKKTKQNKEGNWAIRLLIIMFTLIFTFVSIFGWMSVANIITEQSDNPLPLELNAAYINESVVLDEQGNLNYRLHSSGRMSEAEGDIFSFGVIGILGSSFIAMLLWIIIIVSFVKGKVIELPERKER